MESPFPGFTSNKTTNGVLSLFRRSGKILASRIFCGGESKTSPSETDIAPARCAAVYSLGMTSICDGCELLPVRLFLASPVSQPKLSFMLVIILCMSQARGYSEVLIASEKPAYEMSRMQGCAALARFRKNG
jgi:hypothetical protein